MPRDAVHMRLDLDRLTPGSRSGLPPGVQVRALQRRDAPELGRLMWRAFHATIDDDFATPAAAVFEAAGALEGRWGPVIWEAGLMAEADDRPVGATVVVRDEAHDLRPLLAFVMTDPGWQRRGLGRWLVEEAVVRLAAIGVDALHLAVTRGNPAMRLYERLGFQIVDRDGAPPHLARGADHDL